MEDKVNGEVKEILVKEVNAIDADERTHDRKERKVDVDHKRNKPCEKTG